MGRNCTCSENIGADQHRSYCEADLRLCFRIGKTPFFSRITAQILDNIVVEEIVKLLMGRHVVHFT